MTLNKETSTWQEPYQAAAAALADAAWAMNQRPAMSHAGMCARFLRPAVADVRKLESEGYTAAQILAMRGVKLPEHYTAPAT